MKLRKKWRRAVTPYLVCIATETKKSVEAW